MKHKPYKNDTKAQAWTQPKWSGKYFSNSAILLTNTQDTQLVFGSFRKSCATQGKHQELQCATHPWLFGWAGHSCSLLWCFHKHQVQLPKVHPPSCPHPCWPLKLRPSECQTHTTPLSRASAPPSLPFRLSVVKQRRSWRKDLAVQSICCSHRGLAFSSQPVIPTGHLTPSCDLCRYHTDKHRHTPETHIQKTGCTAHWLPKQALSLRSSYFARPPHASITSVNPSPGWAVLLRLSKDGCDLFLKRPWRI